MIRSIHLESFKSFDNTLIEFSPLTFLVGASGAGKSNILDAVRFIQGMALGFTVSDAGNGTVEAGGRSWPGIRGGTSNMIYRDFAGGSVSVTSSSGLHYHIEIHIGDDIFIEREFLVNVDNMFSSATGFDSDIMLITAKGKKGDKVAYQEADMRRSSLQQINNTPDINCDVLPSCSSFISMMKNIFHYELSPHKMRGYSAPSSDLVSMGGENISSIIRSICMDPATKRDLLDWISELGAPELADIAFSTTDLGDVMLVLVEKEGHRVPARSLSDGTLRFLGLLVILRTVPTGSILLLEEIENGLNPTRARILVEAMEAATKTRGVQIIATTHSPSILAALSPGALRQTVLVARPPGSQSTIVKPFGELPDFSAVVERKGIEGMLSSGWLESAL